MKFYIRRAVVGAVAVPVVAGIYFAGYAVLIGLGAEPTNTPQGVWENGIGLGWLLAIGFTFAPQLIALEKKFFGGEN